ncbi:tetratricopeptide repeat protein [Sphingomonas sp. SUN019]|uniref:tetratricopeptide repeat protein n=1 Tax=Sphingomonas sp. SUN019 TaxID=2937788 RepID=UPI0021642D13|nr:tetratricopeptide repeat protein [Sphingomonas sp. SUN019]UVO51964.1 tetratricopeptide repeat protein [Sphingomonas sp. SUN019]
MTFMGEATHTYPLLRGRRKRRGARMARPAWLGARTVRLAGVLLVAAALVGGIVLLAQRASAPDPRAELATGLRMLERGNYTAARTHVQAATAERPDWELAQAVLGRVHLALREGVAAEGALNRAAAGGMPAARLHHLFADAWLQQGDADRAADETARAAPAYARYAARVRSRTLAAMGDAPAATHGLQALVTDAPRDADAWTDLAQVRFDVGDVTGADQAVQRSLTIDPDAPEALTLRAQVIRSRYGLIAALPWFEAALKRDAHYYPALIEYAATLGDAGQSQAMLDTTRRALEAKPGDPRALYLLAVLAARADRFDLSRAMLGKIGGSGSIPGVLLLGGALNQAAGKYEQAVLQWRELVARQPMNIVARRLLGAALLRSGDAQGALDTLEPIATRPDADSYTLALVGRAFEASGRRALAAGLLDRAARQPASSAPSFGEDVGLAALAQAAAAAPGDPGVAVSYVRGLIDAGDGAGAYARAQAIAAASPGAPGAQLMVGDVLATRGDFRAALSAYARAADLRFDAPTLLRMAEASERGGRSRAGAQALALYLSQNPDSIVARRALANLQIDARDWTGAIDTLEGLRGALGPRDAVVLAQLGYAYTGAGDPQTGKAYARAAYRLAPMNPTAADAYARALHVAGDTRAARQLARKVQALLKVPPRV